MSNHKTMIDGHTVDLDLDTGDGASGCWVSRRTADGEYSASLALLEVQGSLDRCNGNCGPAQLTVRETIIDKITAWAEEKGY